MAKKKTVKKVVKKSAVKLSITKEEALAIMEVKDGADVYGYGLAGVIRKMQRRGITDLIEITDPMQYEGDGTDQMPYFGAIATKKGKLVAELFLMENGE